jgi:hypothetical protein
MSETFEIMLSDFTEEAQKAILAFYGVDSPEDGNWDVMPIAVLEKSEEE